VRTLERSCILQAGLVTVALLLFTPAASAEVCDLTVAGSTCGPVFSGATYGDWTTQPTGTEYLDAQGILLGDVPIVTIDGVEYREFYLNLNQVSTDSKNQLSLDELLIYLSPTETEAGYNSADKTLNGLTAIYDMDAGLRNRQDNWIKLNYALNTGTDAGNMVAYIPNSLFSGPSTQFVYLYSRFGVQSGTGDAQFEEWWVMKRPLTAAATSVPEPGVLLLLGLGALPALRRLRRRH
jgi:hypothetical protein